MEILLIICVAAIITLLVRARLRYNESINSREKHSCCNGQLPDIMGKSRSFDVDNTVKSLYDNPPKLPNVAMEDKHEYVIQEYGRVKPPLLENEPDWLEEEEELQKYVGIDGEYNLAQGVSFEELITIDTLIRKERSGQSQKGKAINVVKKIYGTELFTLLENSMKKSSHAIMELLDDNLLTTTPSSSLETKDVDLFDIKDFT
ncbi:conjugal transfer protein TraD [Chryseobacterium indologenes]|uniref:conjugal transfer protein TraD n=1 Tax=Chryseobacterium indologenes TaxID=253 RepID=UPI001108E5D6|nr:conjugal transfer protein TraD [Chryseobacterium indologenes]TLX26566.1 conjugal transfer protein TraD [Chryseobacterium indologenes]